MTSCKLERTWIYSTILLLCSNYKVLIPHQVETLPTTGKEVVIQNKKHVKDQRSSAQKRVRDPAGKKRSVQLNKSWLHYMEIPQNWTSYFITSYTCKIFRKQICLDKLNFTDTNGLVTKSNEFLPPNSNKLYWLPYIEQTVLNFSCLIKVLPELYLSVSAWSQTLNHNKVIQIMSLQPCMELQHPRIP